MKNALIVALGLVGAALILSSATSAERTFEGGGSNSGANDSVPVDVQNFPASQVVTGAVDIRTFPHTVNVQGTVDVGNLPAVQQVAGTVDVGNLPLDAEGNVRVAGNLRGSIAFQSIRFVRFTEATYMSGSVATPLTVSKQCHSEMPGTRVCFREEIFKSIPPPEIDWDWAYTAEGCMNQLGSTSNCDGLVLPGMCCGF